jgi:hypothetical protein
MEKNKLMKIRHFEPSRNLKFKGLGYSEIITEINNQINKKEEYAKDLDYYIEKM